MFKGLAGDIWDHPAPKEGPWINTIDAEPPASEVVDLPAEVNSLSVLVSWSGQDDAAGSGIASYDIYVSDNGGPFVPWLQNTTLTEDTFTGEDGHTYAFYGIARDNVGNREAAPSVPDAQTTLLGGDTDGDGFMDDVEEFLGTDPLVACGPDAWPPDFNDDTRVNLADVFLFRAHFATIKGHPDYDQRFDLNADERINLADVFILRQYFATQCSP